MKIRQADKHTDYSKVWEIFKAVIATGDTYVFDPDTPKESLARHWFADYMDTFVAEDESGAIVGTYIIKPNQVDLGSHIVQLYGQSRVSRKRNREAVMRALHFFC